MANETILPGSISKAAHVVALDVMVADRFEAIDTNVVIMNLIDTAPAAALPFLAEQFNILSGYKGWRFATTDLMQRTMLKRAIELNILKGTPQGVIEILKLIGIVGAIEIQERMTIYYDGSWTFDGSVFYGNHVAYFRVLLDIANANNIPMSDIRGVILEYKGTRNRLFDVSFRQPLNDTLQSTDELYREYDIKIQQRIKNTDTLTLT
jgi:hypothetical protein